MRERSELEYDCRASLSLSRISHIRFQMNTRPYWSNFVISSFSQVFEPGESLMITEIVLDMSRGCWQLRRWRARGWICWTRRLWVSGNIIGWLYETPPSDRVFNHKPSQCSFPHKPFQCSFPSPFLPSHGNLTIGLRGRNGFLRAPDSLPLLLELHRLKRHL